MWLTCQTSWLKLQSSAALVEHFITFDPADVDEKLLLDRAIAAAKEGQDFVDVEPHEFGVVLTKPRISVLFGS